MDILQPTLSLVSFVDSERMTYTTSNRVPIGVLKTAVNVMSILTSSRSVEYITMRHTGQMRVQLKKDSKLRNQKHI
jgi:hypothetical protein